jgi:hypothetical protein
MKSAACFKSYRLDGLERTKYFPGSLGNKRSAEGDELVKLQYRHHEKHTPAISPGKYNDHSQAMSGIPGGLIFRYVRARRSRLAVFCSAGM